MSYNVDGVIKVGDYTPPLIDIGSPIKEELNHLSGKLRSKATFLPDKLIPKRVIYRSRSSLHNTEVGLWYSPAKTESLIQ